jgi:uncharacterized protein DUF5989
MNDSQRQTLQPHSRPSGLLAEYWSFVRQTGKWWLIPVLVVTLALGLLIFLGGTGAAPFIYTLF